MNFLIRWPATGDVNAQIVEAAVDAVGVGGIPVAQANGRVRGICLNKKRVAGWRHLQRGSCSANDQSRS